MNINTKYVMFAGKERNSALARAAFAIGVALLVLTQNIKASLNEKEDHLERIQLSSQKDQYSRDTNIQNSSSDLPKMPRMPSIRYSLLKKANKKEDTLPSEAPIAHPSILGKKPAIPPKPKAFLNKQPRILAENTKTQESTERIKSSKDPETLENPASTLLSDINPPKKPLRKSLKNPAPQPPSIPKPAKTKCPDYKIEGKSLAGAVPTPLVEIAKSKENKKL